MHSLSCSTTLSLNCKGNNKEHYMCDKYLVKISEEIDGFELAKE
jgi:hypothetical protein